MHLHMYAQESLSLSTPHNEVLQVMTFAHNAPDTAFEAPWVPTSSLTSVLSRQVAAIT